MPQLTAPSTAVRASFLEAARDLRDEGWLATFPGEKVAADFDGYVRRVRAEERAWGVPVTTFWYTEGPLYLGTVIVRHRLTPELTRDGGHVGYHVAPRRRRQGHATAMLAAAVSGVLENTLDGVCRYWINGTR